MTVDEYLTHARRYGPDLVLETYASEEGCGDLDALAHLVAGLYRLVEADAKIARAQRRGWTFRPPDGARIALAVRMVKAGWETPRIAAATRLSGPSITKARKRVADAAKLAVQVA